MPEVSPLEASCLWRPSEERVAAANVTQFIASVNRLVSDQQVDQLDSPLESIGDLQTWSQEHSQLFWKKFLQDSDLQWEGSLDPVLIDGADLITHG